MNSDALYSYVIDSTWLFLGSWVALLLGAYVLAFRQDWRWRRTRLGTAENLTVGRQRAARSLGQPLPHPLPHSLFQRR
jgi:hypothetical protein